MKSEVLIAHVPPRIATLVKAKARDRQLSTSRFLTKLIEREIEPEEAEAFYDLKDLEADLAEAKANSKTYTSTEELLHDLHEYAKKH
ncbi:MAG: hypothetical protein LBD40_02280 [Puniceicoccales bacterium]|jgi:SOS response regulatory protein OraA/RecX|nr:hypothetical protein [Puniceicoccales bacterium]